MLISHQYKKIQREFHRANPNYGMVSTFLAPVVANIIKQMRPTELLDYGAGKGRLGDALNDLLPFPIMIQHYDPAIPEWSTRPEPCEFVVCIDVLEHVEPEFIDNVLDDLVRLTLKVGIFTVSTVPAKKTLPDGRNAHLIQKPTRWWLPKFLDRFELVNFSRMPQGFWIIVQKTGDGIGQTPVIMNLAGLT